MSEINQAPDFIRHRNTANRRHEYLTAAETEIASIDLQSLQGVTQDGRDSNQTRIRSQLSNTTSKMIVEKEGDDENLELEDMW